MLPLEVDQITAEWLSGALSERYPGTTVAATRVDSIIWGTATKVLLELDYPDSGTDSGSASGTGLPGRLCVKGGFSAELRPIMSLGYRIEALFYRDIAPRLGSGLPTCYFADADADQGIIVLDDLATLGARFADARQPLTVDQVADGLRTLATLHAMPDVRAPWLDQPPHFRPMVTGLLQPANWDAQLANCSSALVRELFADRARIERAFHEVWAGEDKAPPALLHGDANLTNVYLDSAGRPRFLDWQFVCRSDWAHDVGLFLIGALSVPDRRQHERQLLRDYLATRAGLGAPAEDGDQAWDAYRRHPLHGALYALTPSSMQPPEVCAALADRYATAAADLDTLTLLAV
jgi:hypothetical protein